LISRIASLDSLVESRTNTHDATLVIRISLGVTIPKNVAPSNKVSTRTTNALAKYESVTI